MGRTARSFWYRFNSEIIRSSCVRLCTCWLRASSRSSVLIVTVERTYAVRHALRHDLNQRLRLVHVRQLRRHHQRCEKTDRSGHHNQRDSCLGDSEKIRRSRISCWGAWSLVPSRAARAVGVNMSAIEGQRDRDTYSNCLTVIRRRDTSRQIDDVPESVDEVVIVHCRCAAP